MVDFEWHPAKAEANLRKHRVPLMRAIECFDDPAKLERLDDSAEYGGDRWILIGRSQSTILFVVYTLRDEKIRLISARKADRHEQIIYWSGYLPS